MFCFCQKTGAFLNIFDLFSQITYQNTFCLQSGVLNLMFFKKSTQEKENEEECGKVTKESGRHGNRNATNLRIEERKALSCWLHNTSLHSSHFHHSPCSRFHFQTPLLNVKKYFVFQIVAFYQFSPSYSQYFIRTKYIVLQFWIKMLIRFVSSLEFTGTILILSQ